MFLIERRAVHFARPMSGVLAVFLLCLFGCCPSTTSSQPVSYRDVVVQQTPIRVLRCPSCETSALILAEQDLIKSKKSGFSDQRIAELEGMLMNNRVRKSGFSDQRLAEMEAMLLNGNKMRRSGFSDQRIAEMEAMLMNSMKRPAQRALTGDQSSANYPEAGLHESSQGGHVVIFPPHSKKSGFSDIRMSEMETMVLTQVRHIRSPRGAGV